MQKVGLFLLFFFFFPLTASALQPCEEKKFVFLLHGIGGSEDSFGHLKNYLKDIDRCFEVFSFEYETGHGSKDPNDFAKDFFEFVETKFSTKGGMSQDKISLIMHSQGGLVGSLWVKKLKDQRHPLLDQLDAFITLSTPYWGAPIAALGKRIFYSGWDSNPLSPFSKAELNEMSFGSKTIGQIYKDFEEIFSIPHLRPLALGGLKKFSNVLLGEDDLVVPIYSARPDHFRVSLNQSLSRDPASIKSESFMKTSYFKFVSVRSNHLNFDLPGIASIPFGCLLFIRCEHPSIKYILSHLNGQEIEESHSRFRQFRVQIFLENKTRDISSFKNAKLFILDRNGVWIPRYQALKRYRGNATNKEGKAFTFYGVNLKKSQRVIKVKISLKNKFNRILEIPVEGGHTSLVHLNLED